ncbi:MAG: dihydrolipoyl dehydrogenase [Alkalispirochaeta sp.]
MAEYDYDLLVIGTGPGGYVSAIRASQLGMKAAVIEKEAPGGVCLNWGCIPSKALIHQAEIARYADDLVKMGASVDMSGVDYGKVHKKSRDAASKLSKGVQALLKKNKVEYIEGTGEFVSAHEVSIDGKKTVSAKNVLIATGSRSREIPGFEFDGKKVLSSRDILGITTLPKKLVILGAGAIGMEFAYVMSSFGVEVTVVEMLDQLLPLEDADAVDVIAKAFKRYGVTTMTGTKAKSLDKSGKGIKLTVEDASGTESEIAADMILVAVGRSPNSEGIGLEKIGVGTERGFVTVGDYYQTSVPGVYAIGDVIASPLLAHVASKEGEIAVEHMAGRAPERKIDPSLIPSAVYCEPEIGSFGLTEKKAKEQGVDYEAVTFPYRGAGKSVAVEKSEGLVKIIVAKETREILGAHVVGYNATELVHELLLARAAELLPEDIATMIHAHPTLSEAVMEGARAVEGWAIHF